MRMILVLIGLALAALVTPVHAQEVAEKDVLTTAITGSITSSGLENPQYVLSFPSIQKLVLEAAGHPVSERRVRRALEGTPVTLDALLTLGILKRDGRRFKVGYLVLTVADQEAMHAAAGRYGESLAEAFMNRGDAFDALFAQYERQDLRDALAFIVISGYALNWNGLELASELGYRVTTPEWPNGDRYLFFSRENGISFDLKGHYLGSHSAPSAPGLFSTFGDGPSQPRIGGLPDVYFGAGDGLEPLSPRPEVYSAVRGHFLVYLVDALNDASRLMMAAAKAPVSREALAAASGLGDAKFEATLALLAATGYLIEAEGGYKAGVVVLDEGDAEMLAGAIALSREIMATWLEENYDRIKEDLEALEILDSDISYELVFSEIWHDLFGFATMQLAAEGFTLDPYAEDVPFRGFEPAVLSTELADIVNAPF